MSLLEVNIDSLKNELKDVTRRLNQAERAAAPRIQNLMRGRNQGPRNGGFPLNNQQSLKRLRSNDAADIDQRDKQPVKRRLASAVVAPVTQGSQGQAEGHGQIGEQQNVEHEDSANIAEKQSAEYETRRKATTQFTDRKATSRFFGALLVGTLSKFQNEEKKIQPVESIRAQKIKDVQERATQRELNDRLNQQVSLLWSRYRSKLRVQQLNMDATRIRLQIAHSAAATNVAQQLQGTLLVTESLPRVLWKPAVEYGAIECVDNKQLAQPLQQAHQQEPGEIMDQDDRQGERSNEQAGISRKGTNEAINAQLMVLCGASRAKFQDQLSKIATQLEDRINDLDQEGNKCVDELYASGRQEASQLGSTVASKVNNAVEAAEQKWDQLATEYKQNQKSQEGPMSGIEIGNPQASNIQQQPHSNRHAFDSVNDGNNKENDAQNVQVRDIKSEEEEGALPESQQVAERNQHGQACKDGENQQRGAVWSRLSRNGMSVHPAEMLLAQSMRSGAGKGGPMGKHADGVGAGVDLRGQHAQRPWQERREGEHAGRVQDRLVTGRSRQARGVYGQQQQAGGPPWHSERFDQRRVAQFGDVAPENSNADNKRAVSQKFQDKDKLEQLRERLRRGNSASNRLQGQDSVASGPQRYRDNQWHQDKRRDSFDQRGGGEERRVNRTRGRDQTDRYGDVEEGEVRDGGRGQARSQVTTLEEQMDKELADYAEERKKHELTQKKRTEWGKLDRGKGSTKASNQRESIQERLKAIDDEMDTIDDDLQLDF